jgi:DNA-directed RNA polymerase sigma subunit (sigma70/sigma32)
MEPLDTASHEMLREQVQYVLAALSERESMVLELCFGRVNGKKNILRRLAATAS